VSSVVSGTDAGLRDFAGPQETVLRAHRRPQLEVRSPDAIRDRGVDGLNPTLQIVDDEVRAQKTEIGRFGLEGERGVEPEAPNCGDRGRADVCANIE
jgi:hypothetical protein